MLILCSFNRFILISLVLLGLSVSSVNAATVQSFGAGTAVTTVDYNAEFEADLGIYNPYLEDGLSFSTAGGSIVIRNLLNTFHPPLAGVDDSRAIYNGQMFTPLAIATQGGEEMSGIEFNIG